MRDGIKPQDNLNEGKILYICIVSDARNGIQCPKHKNCKKCQYFRKLEV
ncbi:MAG: hypothetical protein ACTSXT_15295 [Candidatus Helarchaeota archaeon]